MSNRELNAIVSYLLDAVVTKQEIPLTSSLPVDVQEDLQFAAGLAEVDLSSESRIRQKLRDQLHQQTALQANMEQMRKGVAQAGHTQHRSTGAAFLSIGLGAAAVAMAVLLIFFRTPRPPEADQPLPAETQESSAVALLEQG